MLRADLDDAAILAELGRRLKRARLDAGLRQTDLARHAGVSARTVRHVEAGESASMDTWLRLLRSLGLLEELDAFLADPGPSPLDLAAREGRARQRAPRRRSTDDADDRGPQA